MLPIDLHLVKLYPMSATSRYSIAASDSMQFSVYLGLEVALPLLISYFSSSIGLVIGFHRV